MTNTADGFNVSLEKDPRGVILVAKGDVDLSCSPRLREEIGEAQRLKPDRIIVDLSSVGYMDSSGVATLIEAMQIARKSNTKLLLCGMTDRVRAVFEIARLDMVFTMVDDREAAFEA